MLSKAQIKYIRLLHGKKIRQEERLFIAEGDKIVSEFLNSVFSVKSIYATRNWIDKNHFLVKKEVTVEEISESELKQISTLTTPNQVLALIHFPKETAMKSVPEKGICLMLDGIRDPGNMGTLIRTADWFGIQEIFCSNDCVEIYNPKVVQASMGSLAHIKIQYDDLEILLQKNKKLPVWAATLKGKNLFQQKPPENLILLMGSESSGISECLLKFATSNVTIPKIGKAESLNVGIAAGIILSWLRGNPK